MKAGRTIGGKRDKVLSESERLEARERKKRKQFMTVATFASVIAIVALGVMVMMIRLRDNSKKDTNPVDDGKDIVLSSEIIDEAGTGVTRKVREYVGFLERDLGEYGYKLVKSVLPKDKTRELDVYIEQFKGYFKLSLDRGVGVSAEDMDRMIRYLKGQGFIGAEYVDLRVEGKGYYKGQFSEEKKEEAGNEEPKNEETGNEEPKNEEPAPEVAPEVEDTTGQIEEITDEWVEPEYIDEDEGEVEYYEE